MNPKTMATVAESSEAMPTSSSSDYSIGSTITKNLGETMPWVEHAVQQAQLYQKAVEEAIDSAVEASKSRLSEIRSTSTAHLHQTIVNFLNSSSPLFPLLGWGENKRKREKIIIAKLGSLRFGLTWTTEH